MDRVDAMKQLQGWADTSVMHFRDLAVFGEQLLLSIRFGTWTERHRPGAGGELGALLAPGGAGLHPRLPRGDRRRPDRSRRHHDARRAAERRAAPQALPEGARGALPRRGEVCPTCARVAGAAARSAVEDGPAKDRGARLHLLAVPGAAARQPRLRPWAQMTPGVPAALESPPSAAALAGALAALPGCNARRSSGRRCTRLGPPREPGPGPSTHPRRRRGLPDCASGRSRAAARGVRVQTFTHHDPAALRRQLRGARPTHARSPGGRRRLVSGLRRTGTARRDLEVCAARRPARPRRHAGAGDPRRAAETGAPYGPAAGARCGGRAYRSERPCS